MIDQDILYQDILYDVQGRTATINRPEVRNALRTATCEELLDAFRRAACDRAIGVIVLTGAGGKAFCTVGDRGAIGGGNVLAALCDLTIASETAIFGQVGPKVGSVDPGFGTAFLARVVGEKKAREMWYLCRLYPAREAMAMGLVNAVVPEGQLDTEVVRWCAEILSHSPTALALAKCSLNADTEHIRGLASLGTQALALYYQTDESQEGVRAFQEKRAPQFRKYVR